MYILAYNDINEFRETYIYVFIGTLAFLFFIGCGCVYTVLSKENNFFNLDEEVIKKVR